MHRNNVFERMNYMKKILIILIGGLLFFAATIKIHALPSLNLTYDRKPWSDYGRLSDMKNGLIFDSGYYLFCTSKSDSKFLEDYTFRYIDIDPNLKLPFVTYEDDELSLYYLRESFEGNNHFINMFDDLVDISYYLHSGVEFSNFHYTKYYDYTLHIPEFTETKDKFTLYLSETKTIPYLIQDFKAYDIIDGYLDSSNMKIISDNYTENMDKQGIYEVTIEVENSVGNTKDYSFEIEVINNTFPTITSPSEFYITSSFNMDYKYLYKNVEARDFQGKPLDVTLVDNEYQFTTNPGNYKIDFVTADEQNQQTSISSVVNVLNSTLPFYTNDKTNVIFELYRELTEIELIDILLTLNPNLEYNVINVNSEIKEGVGYNYVFYEISDTNFNVIEERLTIHFLDIIEQEEIIPVEVEKNYDHFFIIGAIAVPILIGSYFLITYIKKKSK